MKKNDSGQVLRMKNRTGSRGYRSYFLWITLGSAALMGTSPAWAGIKYVDGAASGNNDGTSWTDAYKTLTSALANVSDNDQVWVAQGTYTENAQLAVSNSGLTIYGGFTSGMTELSQRDSANFVVKVDGNLAYRCFNITAANVTLDGLTIQRGKMAGYGGGIYNAGSGLIVQSCIITNCTTTGEGAGSDNHAGGGIYSKESMAVLSSVVINNKASLSGNGYGGGGIYFDSTGILLVSNTVLQSNMAQDANAGNESYGAGGAIQMAQGGQLNALNCIFDGNAVLHNEVDKEHRGGAIYLKQGSGGALVVNCTFYGNNVVRGFGGAIYSSGAPLAITNSIFWANTRGYRLTGQQIFSSGSVSIDYACLPGTATDELYVGGTRTVSNVITNDPLFANAGAHDLHLKSRGGRWTSSGWVTDAVISPCIDAGNPASAYDNEPAYNGGRINLGAYGNTAQASKTAADTAISNGTATYVPGQTVATLHGMLTYTGAAPAEVWVYWGKTDGTNNETQWANTNYFGTNTSPLPASYSTNVTVEINTTYYYTFKSANQYGTNWATPSASFFTIGIPPKMTIQAIDANASELGSDPGVFTITGDSNMLTNLSLTVYYTISGTADNGVDYTTIPLSATIPAGSTNVSITIHPKYDTSVEVDETVTLTLVSDPLYTFDSPGTATVTIADNPTAGVIVYLDKNVVGGVNDGTSWANACTNFSSALARVGSGGAIWVAQGNYLNGAEITVSNPNITILGGFTNGMTQLAQRNPSANPVIIDGNNAYRCFSITAANVTLDGLTIQRGRISDNGAGINNTGNGLTITSCVISNCVISTGDKKGGGIYSTAQMQVYDSLLANNVNMENSNGGGGGGIAFDSTGTLLVTNTFFRSNVARSANAGGPAWGDGGAICMLQACTLNAQNCVFDSNTAYNNNLYASENTKTGTGSGGAIFIGASDGNYRIRNCTFYNNAAMTGESGGSCGGAISSQGAPLSITNSIFWANTCGYLGQQIYGKKVSIGYCCFSGTNSADIYIVSGGELTLSNVITNDPLFADAAGHDFHLKSSAGRWSPATLGGWFKDAVTSPCIDAGNPASSYSLETDYNGKRINLGAYGNTPQASRSKRMGGTLLVFY